jgi:PAS domain S-box-containing protein
MSGWHRAILTNGLLIGTCAGALLVLLFLAIDVDRGFEQNARLRQDVSESYDARAALQAVLTRHLDIELGQRGYVITGNPQFLQPYRDAEERIEANLEAFAKRAGEGQSRHIAELRRASAEKRQFVSRTIDMVEAGQRAVAERLIASGEGKDSMDRIRTLVAKISEIEREQLRENTIIADAARANLRQRTFILLVGLIILLALSAFFIARSQLARQRAYRRAQNLAARQEAIFDSAKDGMIVLNPSGSIESLNPTAAAMFGVAPESLLRRDIGSLFEIAPDRGQIETFLRRLTANREANPGQIQEIVGRRSDGTSFPLEVSVSPVHLMDATLFLAVIRDISERREVEQMKSEFVATVSHELRTPLTSIAGSLGLISGGAVGEVSPKVARLIEIAHSNAVRLVRLINDILDIEKIEAGRMQFNVRPLALAPILEEAARQMAGFAQEFDVFIHIEPFASETAVLADEDRLMQVVSNLLSNAVKFSPRGEAVSVRVSALDRRARVSITDRGTGIPEAFRNRIFGKFAQADASDSRQKGGTGLGLSIVREIIVRLGGSVSFESDEGKGTTFHVDLPSAELPSSSPKERIEQINSRDRSLPTILHVDDDPDMLAVVAGMFEGKAHVHSTPSVAESRALVGRNIYDGAILDVGMLDGCGTDLAMPLRKRFGAIPIILFTAQEIDCAVEDVDLVLVKSRASLELLVRETLERVDAAREGREKSK